MWALSGAQIPAVPVVMARNSPCGARPTRVHVACTNAQTGKISSRTPRLCVQPHCVRRNRRACSAT
jgi:hypothetical protein